MTAALLLRTLVVGALVALAAMLAERGHSALGWPRRFLWIGALLLSTGLGVIGIVGDDGSPPVASDDVAPTSIATTPSRLIVDDAPSSVSSGGDVTRSNFSAAVLVPDAVAVPRWLSALDRPVGVLWFSASLLWGALLVASAVRLGRQRAHWQPRSLDGMPVYVSHDVGPALFGLARFGIVVPAWVADLETAQRRLIVAHEREHARAGDPLTLLVGALLVLLQPLNPFAWFCFQRLRLAIEIDCDARVLAHAGDVRSYGELLLDVGERTLAGVAPIAALAESGRQLVRRIDAMSRPRVTNRLWRASAAASAAALLTAAAWQVPRPMHVERGEQGRSDAVSAASARAIVRIHEVGLHEAELAPTVLVWGDGGAIGVAIGNGEMRRVTDTLRLQELPAMRLDVTEADAVVRLVGRGYMRLGATVEGGAATRLSAASSQITFLRGGMGVRPDHGTSREPTPSEESRTAIDSRGVREPAVRAEGGRTIVRLTRIWADDTERLASARIWGDGGPISIGLADSKMRLVTDTLATRVLPGMRIDVTDADAVVEKAGGGYLRIGAIVEGDPEAPMSAIASKVTLLSGGRGIVIGHKAPTDSTVRREIAARFPGIFDEGYGLRPVVWVHADENDRVVHATQGREGLEIGPDGYESITYQAARERLPGIGTGLAGPREYMKLYTLHHATRDCCVLVVWVHKSK